MFNQQKFGEDTITQRTRIFSKQVDQTRPNWLSGRIKTNLLEDDVGILQYGSASEHTYLDFSISDATPSSWSFYPTAENPSSLYKFTSMEVKTSLDLFTWSRQTYSLLDWLGDIGGLFDALRYLFFSLAYPVSEFALQTSMLASFFRLQQSDEQGKSSSLIQVF